MNRHHASTTIAVLTTIVLLASCQTRAPATDILAPVPELGHGLMQGYLNEEPPLNSAAFMPAPPEAGSAKQQADEAASEALRALEGTARWIWQRAMQICIFQPRPLSLAVRSAPK